MKKWTPEQYEERERVMRESNKPLSGTKMQNGYMGYFGSREMIADIMADSLYERRALYVKMLLDILSAGDQ
jgi:hypothetical protein